MRKRKRNSVIPRGKNRKRSSPQKKFRSPAPFKSLRTWIGRVQKNQRGFAFIIPHENGQEDTYVAPREARSLMNGDIVEYRVHRQGPRSQAEIVKVLERACKTVLGQVQGSSHKYFIETSDGDFITLENVKPKDLNSWVLAQMEHYPDESSAGLASVKEVIGKELLPKHDHLITIARFSIQEHFSQDSLKEAERLRAEAEREYLTPSKNRKDLRHLPFVTIDGEDAKDFDDAILVTESIGHQAFKLFVAIADVSFFVRPGTSLDQEAQKRSTSTYFPGYCIPMLPESLSNDLCSLNPKTDKLVLVAEMTFDKGGQLLESTFYEGIIKTAARLTYTQVHDWFQGKPESVPADCLSSLGSAKHLFNQLQKQRVSRGVLDFQLPECRFEIDSEGVPVKAYPFPSWESHRLIEEFMVSANSAVAKALKDFGVPSLYRIHEAPQLEAIEELNQLMRSLGFSFMLKEVSPHAFSKILAHTTGKKGASTLHKAILRAQKQARYEPDPKGHFGLALKDYTHFTSPIRRYPDLIVHRSLKRFILQQKSTDKESETLDFVRLGELTSERERRAMEAERFITRRKQCWFMSSKIGQSFEGVISGVIPKGIFVEVAEHAIEGFVPVESLQGYYEFDERKGCMRRRPGHTTLSIGDKIDIQVARVSIEDNEITFFHLSEE